MNTNGRILAIDYGQKRTGIAVTDPLCMFAQPLTTVETHTLFAFLQTYFHQENVHTLVLGYPTNLENQATDLTEATQQLFEQLKTKFSDKKVVLVDERFSSKIAAQTLFQSGMKKKDRQKKENLDKVSAAIILQTYLSTIQ